MLTISAGTFPGLVEALQRIPISVEEHPLLTFAPPLDWGPVDEALGRLAAFQALAFTSPRAAQAFVGRWRELGMDPAAGSSSTLVVWAGGAGTTAALTELFDRVRSPSERQTGATGSAAALADAMLMAGTKGPVLFPCGEIRRDELPIRLRHEGVEVQEVVCYRSVLASENAARLAAERARVLLVASPSVADLLARACPPGVRPHLVAVGPTTAASARASGWPPAAVAARPAVEALVGAVRSVLNQV